ncbi:MAG: glycoside hydrolase [Spirochaetaceae bacterium]|jgi:spore germination protein YaaH|nr:glycoside hydrolase [Spirochaetaceae bacterium]
MGRVRGLRDTLLAGAIVSLLFSCASPPAAPTDTELVPGQAEERFDEADDESEVNSELPEGFDKMPVSTFTEVWVYVTGGNEGELKADYPISDVAYFSAGIDSYGKLVNVPKRSRLSRYQGRVHLVLEGGGAALTHFVLKPGSSERTQLVADLTAAAKDFDGLQIDFEAIPARDADNYRSFLAELRARLPGKIFSVALHARTRTLENDAEDYGKILPLADKIFVMAYDEHWSASAPGPIASMDWCRAVVEYSLKTVGPDKLIMGLPLYGRIWGSERTNRAMFHSGMERLRRENNAGEARRENDIPTFTYQIPVTVTGYYEDAQSLSTRLDMYRRMRVQSVGFWRLGQETPVLWKLVKLAPD